MFINDIEFIDPLSQRDLESNSAVIGGASAYVSTNVSTDDGEVSASIYMKATGNRSTKALGKIKTKVNSKKAKPSKGIKSHSVSHGVSYGTVYAMDDDGMIVYDSDFSSVLF